MFIYKKQKVEPDKISVGLTQFDENRMNAVFTITFRYGILLVDTDWECFELEKREILTESQLGENFDVIINNLHKKYEAEYLVHSTNLKKIADYNDKVITATL